MKAKKFRALLLQKLKKPHAVEPEQMERRPSANQSDNLWRNYQQLLYLETSRDEILNEVHKELSNEDEELEVQSKSFQDIEIQSDLMFQQIQNVFLRLYKLATYDQHLLETCVKIVDKEERRDAESLGLNKTENEWPYVAPGRPKRWRKKCLDIVQDEVSKRTAVTAPSPDILASDTDGSGFLVHLTKARDDIKRDLERAKALSGAFTSEWDMYNTYQMTYYENVMSQMKERFSFDLNQKETVEVLSWMIYCRDRVFNCTNVDCKACHMIADLQKKFLSEKRQHIHDWMKNALQRDIKDWQSGAKPTKDSNGAPYTLFPIDILRMLEENMSQARDMSQELYGNISSFCLEQLDAIMESYTVYAKYYINQETAKLSQVDLGLPTPRKLSLKDRTRKNSKEPRPAHFVQYSVALLNNFDKIKCRLQEITPKHHSGHVHKPTAGNNENNNRQWKVEPQEKLAEPLEKLIQKIEEQTRECAELLLPKLLEDLRSDLATLLTRSWLTGNVREAVDVMCDVMTSYLRHLRDPMRSWLLPQVEEKLIAGYLLGLTDKRRRWEERERDRLAVSDKLCREAQQLERFFQELHAQTGKELSKDGNSPWGVVKELAGVLQVGDEQTAITDITVIASKYPDFTEKHARRLLKVRGDFSKSQISKIIAASMGKKRKANKQGLGKQTIFSKLLPV